MGRTIEVKLGPLQLARHGKLMVAHAMFYKGTQFLGAGMLLDQKNGYPDVVIHLVAQGVEILQKGLLLARDYDRYRPELRKIGHDLVRGADVLESAFGLRPMRKEARLELQAISDLYRQHLLRYGGVHDLFGGPKKLPMDHVLRRSLALTRWGDRFIARLKKEPNQTPEPTTLLVMPRAGARVTPSRVVAHL